MESAVIGLVPAAGRGLRLGLPYPKELYPIIRDSRYRPVARFVLDNLVQSGIDHVVFVVNETKHQVIGYFGDGHRFGAKLTYVVQEGDGADGRSTSPGLAHALDCAFHVVAGKTVYFGMPDTIMEPQDVFARLRMGADARDDAVLGLFRTSRPEKFGMVRVGPEGRVLELIDKPRASNLVDMWGCMMWRPPFTEHLRTCVRALGMSDFAEIINAGIQAGLRVRGVRIVGGSYKDLGTYEEILELDRSLCER